MGRGFHTWCRWKVQSRSLSLSPSALPPPRWPDVPKRKRKNSQCSVKSMSGKDSSCLSSPLCGFFVNSKQKKSKQVPSAACCALFGVARRSAATCPILRDAPGFIQMIRWCESHKHTALCLLYFPTRLVAKCGFKALEHIMRHWCPEESTICNTSYCGQFDK